MPNQKPDPRQEQIDAAAEEAALQDQPRHINPVEWFDNDRDALAARGALPTKDFRPKHGLHPSEAPAAPEPAPEASSGEQPDDGSMAAAKD